MPNDIHFQTTVAYLSPEQGFELSVYLAPLPHRLSAPPAGAASSAGLLASLFASRSSASSGSPPLLSSDAGGHKRENKSCAGSPPELVSTKALKFGQKYACLCVHVTFSSFAFWRLSRERRSLSADSCSQSCCSLLFFCCICSSSLQPRSFNSWKTSAGIIYTHTHTHRHTHTHSHFPLLSFLIGWKQHVMWIMSILSKNTIKSDVKLNTNFS